MDAAEYRRQAKHYLTCAWHMSDPDARRSLLDIAAYWVKLAEHAEQNWSVVQQPEVTPRGSLGRGLWSAATTG